MTTPPQYPPPAYDASQQYPPQGYNAAPPPKKKSSIGSILVSVLSLIGILGYILSHWLGHRNQPIIDLVNADAAIINTYYADVDKLLEPITSMPDSTPEDSVEFIRAYNTTLSTLADRTHKLIADENALEPQKTPDDFRTAYGAYKDSLLAIEKTLDSKPPLAPAFLQAIRPEDKAAVATWLDGSNTVMKSFNTEIPIARQKRTAVEESAKAHGIQLDDTTKK